MPPKAQFSKEIVLNSAFEILKEKGWSAVTARNIADKLGASTQPIYSYIKSMDDLVNELRKMSLEELIHFQVKEYTDDIYVNMAVGYVRFAQAEKNLFAFIYLEQPLMQNKKQGNLEAKWLNKRIEEISGKKLDIFYQIGTMNESQMDELTLNSWIYIHGLAVLLSSGALEPMDDKKIVELVSGAGYAFYMKTQSNQQ